MDTHLPAGARLSLAETPARPAPAAARGEVCYVAAASGSGSKV